MANLESNETSTMGLFLENTQSLKAVNSFGKQTPSQMFDCVLNVSLWITKIIHENKFHLFDIVNLHVTSKYAYVTLCLKCSSPFPIL